MNRRQLDLYKKIEAVYRDYRYSMHSNNDLFYCAKQKLREVLLRRGSMSDNPFSWGLWDETNVEFSSPHEDIKGFSMSSMWAAIDDVDQSGLDKVLFDVGVGVHLSRLFFLMSMCSNIFDDGDMHLQVKESEDNERFLPSKDRNEMIEAILAEMHTEFLYGEEEEEEIIEEVEEITDLLLALDKAADGLYEEALECDLLCSLVGGIKENIFELEDGSRHIVSDRFILKNIGTILFPYYWGVPDNRVTLSVFSSKEVYMYSRYKHNLPDDVREVMDMALDLYTHPFGRGFEDVIEDIDEVQNNVVMVLTEGEVNSQDIHPMWKDVVEFLAVKLPTLRKEYMSSDISGFPSGDPGSFFVPLKGCQNSLSGL